MATELGPITHLLDIYSVTLHLAWNRDAWAAIRAEVDSLNPDPDSLGFTSRDIDTDTGMPHISFWVDVERHRARGADSYLNALVETVGHEGYHGAGLILDHFGQHYDGDSEAMAYLVGWLAEWMWEHLPDN